MPKHKKLWKKPKVIIVDIGKCKYCNQDMTNQESFVAFYPKGKAHYDCMSCLLYTSPSPRDLSTSRMPSSA